MVCDPCHLTLLQFSTVLSVIVSWFQAWFEIAASMLLVLVTIYCRFWSFGGVFDHLRFATFDTTLFNNSRLWPTARLFSHNERTFENVRNLLQRVTFSLWEEQVDKDEHDNQEDNVYDVVLPAHVFESDGVCERVDHAAHAIEKHDNSHALLTSMEREDFHGVRYRLSE